jgi:hypothetical protein
VKGVQLGRLAAPLRTAVTRTILSLLHGVFGSR